MGILSAAFDSIGGVLADQWKDIITAGPFDEHVVVAPGIRKDSQNGRGANYGAEDILSNGSLIFVPENTAAFVFSQAGIEQVITTPGGFEYRDGEATGMSPDEKRVAFVNLREIRGLKFGTRGPLAYNDLFYGTDLEVYAYGSLSLRVTNPERFVRNFVPANVSSYSLDDPKARGQLLSEFLNSFIAAVNSLSANYRVSQLPSQTNALAATMTAESENAGTWPERFGIQLTSIAVENIEFSEDSRELVRQFSEKKMGVRAYEDVSQQAANVAAQQMIAEGVRDNGLGDGGGMLFGMNLASALNPQNASIPAHAATGTNLDNQIETVKKLKELLDAGVLTKAEFDTKKKEILGL